MARALEPISHGVAAPPRNELAVVMVRAGTIARAQARDS